MEQDGNPKRARRLKKPQKLKFKPKVPAQKAKKPSPEMKQEEPKPIDEEMVKRLRTGKGAAQTLQSLKDELSAHNPPSTFSSPSEVSLSMLQSGGHMQGQPMSSATSQQKKALQIPKVFHETANPAMLYDNSDDDGDDDDNDELQETQPSLTECETSIRPAQELNLLEEHDIRRMFLFQLPKSLPLPRIPPTIIERNGRTTSKAVKEGCRLKDLPEGYLGKMLIYRSGKIKMKLGDVTFNAKPGVRCWMAQDAVTVNTRQKHCCSLGEIENRHVVVTPDVDSLLND